MMGRFGRRDRNIGGMCSYDDALNGCGDQLILFIDIGTNSLKILNTKKTRRRHMQSVLN